MSNLPTVADQGDPVSKPVSWDKAVAAAYLRLLGSSQRAAAKGAGIGPRTLRRYEQCSWWQGALEEASDRWLNDLEAASRKALLDAVHAGDGDKALKILERLDPRLAPPAQQMEVGGIGGGPLVIGTIGPAHPVEDEDGDDG